MISVRMLRVFLIWSAIATACFRSNSQVPALELPPDGWTIYPTPKVGSDVLRCANYSQREWRVAVSDVGKTEISLARQPHGRPSRAELPPSVKLQAGMVANLTTMRVRNGWLLGFDGGEFGGGLWFSALDGQTQQLSEENVHGFIEASGSVLIFVGLYHMVQDSGKVLAVTESSSRG